MKRYLCMIVSIALLFVLSACNRAEIPVETTNGNDETQVQVPDETTAASGEDIIVQQLPLCSVAMPVLTHSEYAEDGTEIFRYSYQNLSLTVPESEIADKIILNYLNRIDEANSTAQSVHEMAKSAYKAGSNWSAYQCVVSYAPMRIDMGVLSFVGSLSTYSGSSHPETVFESVNYDMVTGNVLSIYSIMDFSANADTLIDLILEALQSHPNAENLYTGYEDTVKALKNSAALDRCWYLSADGLCVFFPPYEIAPYSAGLVVAQIPYEKLSGILSDTLFPAERDLVSGQLLIEEFDHEATGEFTQIAELILDEGASSYLLYTKSGIYDISIDYGTLSANGNVFTKQYTVFATASLTPGDAIMIEASLGETSPCLCIRYRSGNEIKTAYLSGDIS